MNGIFIILSEIIGYGITDIRYSYNNSTYIYRGKVPTMQWNYGV